MIRPTKLARIGLLAVGLGAAAFALGRAGLLRNFATWGVFLLCPLMHVAMMAFMGHGAHSHGHASRDGAKQKDGEEIEAASDERAASCH